MLCGLLIPRLIGVEHHFFGLFEALTLIQSLYTFYSLS